MKLLSDTIISFTRRYPPEDNGVRIIDYVNGPKFSKLSPNEYEKMAALYDELRRISKNYELIIETGRQKLK